MSSDYHDSFVHDLQIATPCKANWDQMVGDDCKRYCSLCNLNVYNVSAMTLAEAEALIIDNEGNVCLRLYRRSDGTVMTKDCPIGLADKLKRRLALSFAGIASICAVVFGWMQFANKPTTASKIPNNCSPPIEITPGRHHVGKLAVPRSERIQNRIEHI